MSDAAGIDGAECSHRPYLRAQRIAFVYARRLVATRVPRSAFCARSEASRLFVVDGMPMNNTVFASSAQRFGLGGFDYGSPITDIDLRTWSRSEC